MRVRQLVVVFASAALLLSACSEETPAPVADTTTPAADAGATADPDGATDAGEAVDDGPAATSAPMDHSAMGVKECLEVSHAMAGVIARGMAGDFDTDLAVVRGFVAGSSSDGRGDVELVLDAYEASYRVIDDAGIVPSDPASLMADGAQEVVTTAEALVETSEVETAMESWEPFLFEACPELAP